MRSLAVLVVVIVTVILARRARAEQALGDKLDLPAFHAVVLGAGAVTLPILDERVDAWIAARQK